jgi:hypothetical protein
LSEPTNERFELGHRDSRRSDAASRENKSDFRNVREYDHVKSPGNGAEDDGDQGLALKFEDIDPKAAEELEKLVACLPDVESIEDTEAHGHGLLSSPKSSTSDIASGNLAPLELSEVPVARSKSKQKIRNRKNKQRTRRRKKALALAKKEAAK